MLTLIACNKFTINSLWFFLFSSRLILESYYSMRALGYLNIYRFQFFKVLVGEEVGRSVVDFDKFIILLNLSIGECQ